MVPAVLLVLGLAAGAVQVVTQQVRVTDASADAARALARGDSAGTAAGVIAASIGATSLSQNREGQFVCAVVEQAPTFGPAAAVGLRVRARACALAGDG